MPDIDAACEGGEESGYRLNEIESPVRRLWLVRHGTTTWNLEQRFCGHHDIPLSERGRSQARWLARCLRLENIGAIYTSDLQRARETAQLIAERQPIAVPLHISPAWREMSFGDWEGLTYQQIAAAYSDELNFFTDPIHSTPPNGEPFLHLLQRVNSAFISLARSSATSGNVILVSHGGPLRTLLCSLLGMPFERQWQLRLDHGSLSAIDFVPAVDDVTTTVTLALLNVQTLPHIVLRKGREP